MSYSISNSANTLHSAEVLSSFVRQLKDMSKTVIFLPLLIVIFPIVLIAVLVYYPFLLMSFKSINKKMAKIAIHVEHNGGKMKFEDINELNLRTKKMLSSLNNLIDKDPDDSLIKNQAISISNTLERIVKKTDSMLYVDVSHIEFTEEELKMFKDLEDFYGNEEPYKKDTFEQLKNVAS